MPNRFFARLPGFLLLRRWALAAGLACAALWPWAAARAEVVHVAVAANFTAPAKALAEVFARTTGHRAELSFGATGAFYTQIKHGAPFDVFMAADAERPARLQAEGDAAPGTRLVYARGRLALWSAQAGLVDGRGEVLRTGGFEKLAIANPRLAPYGAAAMQTLQSMGLADALAPRLVTGESIGQAFNFVATGNAQLGFVALAQVIEGGKPRAGSLWVVPQGMHAPIVQEALVLRRAAHNPAAKAWMALLQSPGARGLIRSFGYEVE